MIAVAEGPSTSSVRPQPSAQAPRSRPHSDDLFRHDVQVALVDVRLPRTEAILEFDTVTEIGDHVPVPCGARMAELRFKKSIRPTMGVLGESFNTSGTPNERGDLATLRWRLLLSIPLALLRFDPAIGLELGTLAFGAGRQSGRKRGLTGGLRFGSGSAAGQERQQDDCHGLQ